MKEICVNIWDDFEEDGGPTYLFIEEPKGFVTDEEAHECLEHIHEVISWMRGDSTWCRLRFFEPIKEYPNMVGTYLEESLVKSAKWEIYFPFITHEEKDHLVDYLNLSELRYVYRFYSES